MNNKIAKVNAGKISAINAGKTKIIAKINGSHLSSTVTVTVKKKSLNAKSIFSKVNSSVVYIEILNDNRQPISSGSGFLISSTGEIVTNYHVIEGGTLARIYLADGKSYYTDTVTRYDSDYDLAVLKVKGVSSLPYLKTNSTSRVLTADKIFALGSPRGIQNTITEGLVSNRNVIFEGIPYVQFSASVTHGNSGGPLVNQYGEVIGVITWGLDDSQNMNYAIPISQLNRLSYGNETTLKNHPVVSKGEGTTVEEEDNDTPDNADFLSYSNGKIESEIGSISDYDFYYFYIDRARSVSFFGATLSTTLSPFLGMTLMDGDGEVITYSSSYKPVESPWSYETINVDLSPGYYYLGVYGGDGLSLDEYLNQFYRISYEFK